VTGALALSYNSGASRATRPMISREGARWNDQVGYKSSNIEVRTTASIPLRDTAQPARRDAGSWFPSPSVNFKTGATDNIAMVFNAALRAPRPDPTARSNRCGAIDPEGARQKNVIVSAKDVETFPSPSMTPSAGP